MSSTSSHAFNVADRVAIPVPALACNVPTITVEPADKVTTVEQVPAPALPTVTMVTLLCCCKVPSKLVKRMRCVNVPATEPKRLGSK